MEEPLDGLKRRHPDLFIQAVSGQVSLCNILERIVQRLLPYAAARISVSENELADRVSVQLGSSTEVNGQVATFDGHTLIVVNIALMMFLHKMLKVFVATLGIGDDEEHAIEMPIKPFNRVVSACKALLDAFWEGKILEEAGLWLADFGGYQIRVFIYLTDYAQNANMYSL